MDTLLPFRFQRVLRVGPRNRRPAGSGVRNYSCTFVRGQEGWPRTDGRVVLQTSPVRYPYLHNTTIQFVAAGGNHSCVVADTKDEVWLELLSPAAKAVRIVLIWGDQTHHQLGLPPDHDYTDFALETKNELSDRAIAAQKAQMALDATFAKSRSRRRRPKPAQSPFAAFSGAGAGAGGEAGAGAGAGAEPAGEPHRASSCGHAFPIPEGELTLECEQAAKLTAFVRRFRQFFVDTMKPGFMLAQWSVEYPVIRAPNS